MSVPDLHRPFESDRRARYIEALGRVIQEAIELGIQVIDLTDLDDADLRAEAKRLHPLVMTRRAPFVAGRTFEGPVDEQICTICKDGKPRNRCRCALR